MYGAPRGYVLGQVIFSIYILIVCTISTQYHVFTNICMLMIYNYISFLPASSPDKSKLFKRVSFIRIFLLSNNNFF